MSASIVYFEQNLTRPSRGAHLGEPAQQNARGDHSVVDGNEVTEATHDHLLRHAVSRYGNRKWMAQPPIVGQSAGLAQGSVDRARLVKRVLRGAGAGDVWQRCCRRVLARQEYRGRGRRYDEPE